MKVGWENNVRGDTVIFILKHSVCITVHCYIHKLFLHSLVNTENNIFYTLGLNRWERFKVEIYTKIIKYIIKYYMYDALSAVQVL